MADTQRLPVPLIEVWEWQGAAACRGMDSATFFHPPAERNAARENRIERAKQICRQCPALLACRDHALRVREPYGIWGGLSEDERAELLGVQSLRYPARTKDLATVVQVGAGAGGAGAAGKAAHSGAGAVPALLRRRPAVRSRISSSLQRRRARRHPALALR